MQRRTDMKKRDDAVSPVIGVMLMLVVTIIIAAVVSTMAGGLFSTQSPAPTLSAATEYSLSNGLSIDVLSVSEAIDTADLKIQIDALANKTRFFATIDGKSEGVTGTGAGITYENMTPPDFGNFTLVSGVKVSGDVTLRTSEGIVYDISGTDAFPDGSIAKSYAPAAGQTPPDVSLWDVEGVPLGQNDPPINNYDKMHRINPSHSMYYYMIKFNDGWTHQKGEKNTGVGATLTYYPAGDLNPGDKVSVKVIYTPNSQTIYSSDVRVVS